jgi:HlyD family secretion protein
MGLAEDGEQGWVRASGTIQANEVQIASEYGGRITQVLVGPGTRVRVDAHLVSLDATVLQDKLAEARAAVSTAQADLDVLQAGARTQEIAAAEATVRVAAAERDGAYTAWQNALRELENPQELNAQIIEARTQVKLAEQAAILAEAQLAREKLLAQQRRAGTDEHDIAAWQVRAAEEALAAAQADHKAAQASLDWLTYIRSEPLSTIAQVHAAEAKVHIAQAAVDVAQAQLEDVRDGPTPEQLAVAQERVYLAQAQADVLRAQLDTFVLYSPTEGIVLSQALYQGELAAPAATILTLADLDHVTLTVYVPVNKVGHISLDQRVRVAVDSFPGTTFAGRVTRIGDQPEYTPRHIATQEERQNTFYAVEIRLANDGTKLKPGMPADATFVPPTRPDDELN